MRPIHVLGGTILILIVLLMLSVQKCTNYKTQLDNPVPKDTTTFYDTTYIDTGSTKFIHNPIAIEPENPTPPDTVELKDTFYIIPKNFYVETTGDSLVNIKVSSWTSGVLDSQRIYYDYKIPLVTKTQRIPYEVTKFKNAFYLGMVFGISPQWDFGVTADYAFDGWQLGLEFYPKETFQESQKEITIKKSIF